MPARRFAGGWSVRETERRAKAAEETPAAPARPHPDQEAALLRGEEALEEAFGHGVRVRTARNGALRAELEFDDLDALLAFAREIGRV